MSCFSLDLLTTVSPYLIAVEVLLCRRRVHGIAAQTVSSTRETGGRSGCAVPWFSAFPTLAAGPRLLGPRLLDWCTLCGLCLRCPWAGGRSGTFAATAHMQPKAASFRIVSPFSFSSHPTPSGTSRDTSSYRYPSLSYTLASQERSHEGR